jgi:hypothetical protein
MALTEMAQWLWHVRIMALHAQLVYQPHAAIEWLAKGV